MKYKVLGLLAIIIGILESLFWLGTLNELYLKVFVEHHGIRLGVVLNGSLIIIVGTLLVLNLYYGSNVMKNGDKSSSLAKNVVCGLMLLHAGIIAFVFYILSTMSSLIP